MPIDTNTPIDHGAMLVPATYINRVQVSVGGPNVRISFGEGFGTGSFFYRSAVAMNIQDAVELAQVLLTIIAQAQGVTPASLAPRPSPSPTMASSLGKPSV